MVRQRKVQIQCPRGSNDSSSSSSTESLPPNKFYRLFSRCKKYVGGICLVVAVYYGTLGYLETRVNTPFTDEKVIQASGLQVPERYWGTYRPGHYFGIKSREPKSPVFGLMWYDLADSRKGVRHWCEQGDNLPTFGWLRHDGETFGEQEIVDPPLEIYTSFVKTLGGDKGGQWTARVNVTSKGPAVSPVGLIWYGALDSGTEGEARLWTEAGGLRGWTQILQGFKVALQVHKGNILHKSSSEAHAAGLHELKEKLYSILRVENNAEHGKLPVLGTDDEVLIEGKPVNFVPIQLLAETPFILDIVYTTEDQPVPALKGDAYTAELNERKRRFDEKFEKKFKLNNKGYSEEDTSIARAALSNCLGGIGYFYGAGRVRSQYTKGSVPYWKAPLYTAVPSRSFFPRGFLWDEGFHLSLVGRWATHIALDIAGHWLDLVNVEGWIPREQILGTEAIARVPAEFIVQSNTAANPPMLLVQLAQLVKSRPMLAQPGAFRDVLGRMFSRLQLWYQWFQSTQKGDEVTTYRWRGREDDGLQLNPKTLTSGLDDYPRASHPSSIERHVDLRCWMYAAADAMVTISNALDRDPEKFEATRDQLGDEDLLNQLHWSPDTQTYADYGLHTDAVKLVRVPPKHPNEGPKVVRKVTSTPQPQLVTSAFGYVSLFPMLLKVLKPTSEKLGKILQDLDKPELLWSEYGLRSLSKSAPLHMKRNTEHDPPYWRGQVWMNINYLALTSLQHYGSMDGPYRERARQLRARLADNLIRNILSEYKRTGYFWEQYSGDTGHGSGCRPFTGWTALFTLAMAD